MIRRFLQTLTLAVLLGASCTSICLAQAEVENKKVLILFNNDSYTATQTTIDRALRSTLKNGSSVPIEMYSEFVGNTRAGTNYEAQFVALLRQKYDGKKFDLIFCIGQFPLTAILSNRAQLFPDTPIVSLAIDQRAVAGLFPAPGVTGVWGQIDFKQNLDLALTLQPATKRVVLVEGVSDTDKDWAHRAQEDFREYGSRLEFSELSGLTIPEMRSALAGLSPDTVVFFISSIRDHLGNTYESPEYLRQVATASTVPIYGTTDGQLGNGIVGGNLLSFDALGKEGAQVGLRILAGEKPEAIAPHQIDSPPLFDWNQLHRLGIREASLPAGSVIQFKEPTVWEEYRWYAIGLLAAVAAETLLMAFMLYSRFRRRQAEAEAARLAGRITEVVSNVPGIVWETRFDPSTNQRRTTFISDYVEKMLGYTPEEWLNESPGFGFRIVVDEDREQAKKDSEEVVKTGIERTCEFRWLTKDGRIRWVENHLVPVRDNGNVIGLRGVAMDITERKLVEEQARQTEEKDKAILSAIPDLMFLQTLDGDYIDYHATDDNDLLVTPEMFLGKNVRDIMPEELAGRFLESFSKAIEGGEPRLMEYTLELEGSDRWYEARIVRTGDKILSIVREITEKRRAEGELAEAHGRRREILESIGDGFFSLDAEMRFTYVNLKSEEIWGKRREDLLGKKVFDVFQEGPNSQFRQEIAVALEKRSPRTYETFSSLARGWFEVSVYPSMGGGLSVYFRDIDERKAAEKALRESEAKLAEELVDLQQLQKISSQLHQDDEIEELYGQILDSAASILRSDAGSIQMYDKDRDGLHLLAWREYGDELLERWNVLQMEDVCRKALLKHDRIIVPDVDKCEFLIGTKTLKAFHQAGIRSVQSTPLVSRSGDVVGIISTHWLTPHQPSERQLRLLDVVARQAADLVERKKAIDALRSSEAFNRTVLTSLTAHVCVIDKDGRIIAVNDAWREFGVANGAPSEKAVGLGANYFDVCQRAADLGDITSRRAIEGIRAVCAGTCESFAFEYPCHSRTEKRWFLLLATPLKRGEGGAVIVHNDISERVRAEMALRESEGRLRIAQQAARVGTWECELETGASVWSEMIWEHLGLEPDEGETSVNRFASFIHPDDRDRVLRKTKEVVTEGSGEYYDEFRIVRTDGRILWLSSKGALIRDENGQRKWMAGVNIDISDRKEADAALRESEQRFRNMAETAPVMIWIADEDPETNYINKQMLDFLGASQREMKAFGWTEFIHQEDKARILKNYTDAFKVKLPFENEFRIRRKDDEYRWLASRGTPRFRPDGKFLGYIGTAFDITERKESQRELQEALEELKGLKNQLEAENIYLQHELQQGQSFGDIVGQSAAIKYVLFKVSQVSRTDALVLISGETGTGKELVARAIHEGSDRRDRPLIKVNCAALTPSLIESELFGHERGSFTGAVGRKIGRFELANGGTLLLDEISELPLDLQAKLLRVLQEGEFERVGGGKTLKTDARIIAATNRDLKLEVDRGKFREDLWYRLNVFPITTPPLRERRDDIPLLTEHFVSLFSRRFGKEINAVSPNTMDALRSYSWPGNVRELANVIERAVINSSGPVLRIHEDFAVSDSHSSVATSAKTLEEIERDHIIAVLEDLQWRIDGPKGGARILGIHPSTLRTRMARLGIKKSDGRSSNGFN